VIVTNHDEYYKLDLKAVYSSMRSPVIIDGRNVFDKTLCETLGFIYMGIGKNRD
jgi:UDPglucose 6-dehydrogenase